MLFSAAERATERRRRPFSIHTPYRIDHSQRPGAPPHVRYDSATTIRPSPPPKDTPTQDLSMSRPITAIAKKELKARTLKNLDVNRVMNGRKPPPQVPGLKPLPILVHSPIKRQVTNPSLKNYADGLFEFTQTRLVPMIPNILSPPPSSTADVFGNVDASVHDERSPQRPTFESKFSDWSITTCSTRDSVLPEATMTRQAIATDLSLMSPDSFFGAHDDTPRRQDFSLKSYQSGYPSSEAYGSHSGEHQPLSSPPCVNEAIVSPAEEFSYFTNYDQYLDVDSTSKAHCLSATEALEDLAFEISPIETSRYATSPLPQLQRSNTSFLQPPGLSRSCSSGTPLHTFAASTPVTPFQQAQVAIQIPHWLIGAIG